MPALGQLVEPLVLNRLLTAHAGVDRARVRQEGMHVAVLHGHRELHNTGVDRRERERILSEGPIRRDGPRDRAEGRALERDLDGSPVVGRPLRQRLRNFQAAADSYLASLGGPLPYMLRLRQIADEIAAHEAALERRWRELAVECDGRSDVFGQRWRQTAEGWSFTAVNVLIDKHNRYYPTESRLPMDPRTGDFVPVLGEPYRKQLLDVEWVLERFPPALAEARAA